MAALIPAAIGLAGSVIGSNSQKKTADKNRKSQEAIAEQNSENSRLGTVQTAGNHQTQTTTQNLWQPQEQALNRTFDQAGNLLDNGSYYGDRYATWSPQQQQTFNQAQNYFGNDAQSMAQNQQMVGGGLQNNYNQAQNTYQQIAQNGGTTPQAIQAQYDAGEPLRQQQIGAVTDSVNANTAQQMATLREQQAGAGGLAGTRSAVQQGILASQGANTIASNVANINQNGYNNAVQQANQGTANQMSAANQLANLGNQGTNLINNSAQQMASNFGNLQTFGNAQQANSQAALNNAYQQYQSPWDTLSQYNALTGNRTWGGSTTSENQSANYSNQQKTGFQTNPIIKYQNGQYQTNVGGTPTTGTNVALNDENPYVAAQNARIAAQEAQQAQRASAYQRNNR
ncbi:hypothetical protein [Thalassospira alkalitolerans]|uniref:hypothetical protein n=1 Tax=Thalassospira alkalitolerans TaxID=1293890 RepID=UPI003AA92AF8